MRDTEFEARQQKVLDVFFKETFARNTIHLGYWIVTGIMVFVQVCLMLVPFQSWDSSDRSLIWLSVMLAGWGSISYISAYMNCTNGDGRVIQLYEKLKYLPISADILRKYRWKKVIRFYGKVYLVGQIGQLFFTLVSHHFVVLENFLIPLVGGLIAPVMFALLVLVFAEKISYGRKKS